MDKQTADRLVAALARAVDAVQGAGGPKALLTQVGAAVQAAMAQGQPVFPVAGSPVPAVTGSGAPTAAVPLRGTLAHAIRTAQGTAGAPSPTVAPPPAGPQAPTPATAVPTVTAAAAALQTSTGSGSVEQMLAALFAYEQAALDADAQQLLTQGMSPAAVARLIAERKAAAQQENVAMMSNISAMSHATNMSIIRNMT